MKLGELNPTSQISQCRCDHIYDFVPHMLKYLGHNMVVHGMQLNERTLVA